MGRNLLSVFLIAFGFCGLRVYRAPSWKVHRIRNDCPWWLFSRPWPNCPLNFWTVNSFQFSRDASHFPSLFLVIFFKGKTDFAPRSIRLFPGRAITWVKLSISGFTDRQMHANDTGLIAVSLNAFGSFGWRQLRNQFTVSRPRSGKRVSFTTIFCVREKFVRMLTGTRNPHHVPEGALIKNVVARNSTFNQFSSHEYRPNVSELPCTTPTESRGPIDARLVFSSWKSVTLAVAEIYEKQLLPRKLPLRYDLSWLKTIRSLP